jgi:hypothetical protein
MTEKTKSVFVRGEGGTVFELDLPLHDTIVEKLQKGYVRRVKNAKGDPYTGSDPIPGQNDEEDEVPALPTERPAVNAPKAEWVGWSVFESERRGEPITPDAADALTKDDLIAQYGTTPTA